MQGAASAEQSRAMRRLNSSRSLSCLPNQNLSVFMYEKIFIFQEGILHRQTYYTLFGSHAARFSLSPSVFIREIDSVSSSTQISAASLLLLRGSNFNSARRHSFRRRLLVKSVSEFRILCIY
jgi:hypothetical protein